MNTQLDAELEKTIIDFGTRNGYPVFYVMTEDEVPPASYFNGVKVSGKMHMFRLQEIAADFARKNNGILVNTMDHSLRSAGRTTAPSEAQSATGALTRLSAARIV